MEPKFRKSADENVLVDWSKFYWARTLFVFDSPQFNPYADYLLHNRELHLAGTRISHKIDRPSETPPIQTIIIGAREYRTDKYSRSRQGSLFGDFNDYLVVMRMPGQVADGHYTFSDNTQDERIIWLVYGITFKGSHAGAHLFRRENFEKFETYVQTTVKTPLPRFFEALFRIPDNLDRIEDFGDFEVVEFIETRSIVEDFGAADPPPAGVERYFLPRNDEGTLADIPITSVHLDPVAACNFRCPGCIEDDVRSKNMCLTTQKICRILCDLHELGCRDVRFYGGEPTLHPDFGLIVDVASAMSFNMMVVTNGSLLKEQRISKSLIEARNLHIRVSLDANSQDTHQRHHGLQRLQVDFGELRRSIIDLIRSKVTVSISYLLTDESLPELAEACQFWYENDVTSFHPRIPMDTHGKWKQLSRDWTNDRRIIRNVIEKYGSWIMVPEWFRTWVYVGDQPDTAHNFDKCYSGYYRIGISPYCGPNEKLEKFEVPGIGKLYATDNAWISMCLYYRYDDRFGCIYPEDLAKWCREGRIEKMVSIVPSQRVCDGTVCSRRDGNQKIQWFCHDARSANQSGDRAEFQT